MTKKELIFNAGAKLFARHSYNSVGIRDIAKEAGVNSAMISYYFDGKAGLLQAIFMQFNEIMINVSRSALYEAKDLNELCELFTRRGLTSARENPDIYKVGLRELNHDSEELQGLRDELSETCWNDFLSQIDRFNIHTIDSGEAKDIRFSAIIGMIFSDILLGGSTYMNDDAMFEKQIEIITDIMQRGFPAHWR